MDHSAHKTAMQTRTKTMQFHLISFTGKEKDEETGYGYLPHQAWKALLGPGCIELVTRALEGNGQKERAFDGKFLLDQ